MQRNNAPTDLHADALTMLQETTVLRDRAAAIARDCLTHLDAGPFVDFIGTQIMRETPPIMFLRIVLDYLHEPATSVCTAQQKMRTLHHLLPNLDDLLRLPEPEFARQRPDDQTLRLLGAFVSEVHGATADLTSLSPAELHQALEQQRTVNAHMTEILRRQADIVQTMSACVQEWLRALEVVSLHAHIPAYNREQFVQNVWDYRL